MSRIWIVVGDTTTGGGGVVSGSPFTDIDGKPVARIGDSVVCLRHGPTVIVTGDPTMLVDGMPVARHGDGLACLCSLVTVQQIHVSIEGGGAGMPVADMSESTMTMKDSAGAASPATSPAGANPAPAPPVVGDCPSQIEFKEDGTAYGFDDYTIAAVPWKSVEKGKTDTIKTEISPPGKFAKVTFKSVAKATATISPEAAASASQVLIVKGVEKGETEIKAACAADLAKFKVKVCVKKTKKVAVRLVHETNYTSTDISDATITAFLEKVYKQAVFEFALTRLPAKTVAFDLDGDGKIDVNSWMSAEMREVRDACKDDKYDYNIFLVDNPSDGSFGFMDYRQRYGFVHAGAMSNPEKSFAHELGHGAFGMTHENGDADNNMSQGDSAAKWRLRKHQWDKINP